MSLTGVNGLYIAGLTLNNSSEHMLFVARSSNITVANINDQSPGVVNGDGIDLVTAYADQLSDSGPVGLLPTHAYIFGSYTAAGLKNTWANENTFNGTDVGFRFKSGAGHGGGIATLGAGDIGFVGHDNIGRTDVCLEVTDQYPDTTGVPAASGAGVFHDILLDNYTCSGMNNLDTGSNIVVNGKALR